MIKFFYTFLFISFFCCSCGVNKSTITYFEAPKDKNVLSIHEGLISSSANKINYHRKEKKDAVIKMSEPILVAQADQEEEWGYYQFPSIGRADDGTLIVGWQMKEDSHKTYGKSNDRKVLPMMSKDNGKTWVTRDKRYNELRGVNQIRLKNGRIFKIITPTSKDIRQYHSFPKPVGKRSNILFYPLESLPEEFQGVYIENGGELIHAKLFDPGALRFAIDNLMPVQWWGNIKELEDGSLIAGTYPNYYLTDEGKVTPSQICFYKSDNGGREWKIIGKVPFNTNFSVGDRDIIKNYGDYEEPAFEILADSTYICVIRTGMVTPMLKTFSYDRGKTWTVPEPFTPNGVDPSLLLLKNGVLVLVSGRPGIQLRFSFDGKGENWSDPVDLIPFTKDEGSYEMNVSCGYPAILEESENSFGIVYSDFTIKNGQGEPRKTIFFRRVEVKPKHN